VAAAHVSRTTRRCSTSSLTTAITRTSICRRPTSADYGWGKGKERPVYPCTGKPQGFSPERIARRLRVHGRQVRGDVRTRLACVCDHGPRVRASAPRTGASGVRVRREISRQLSDGARQVAVLLRRRELGG
jgi:hypothetical protein